MSENILLDMKSIYPDFIISAEGDAGDKPLDNAGKWTLKVKKGDDPENWKIHDSQSGELFQLMSRGVPSSIRMTAGEFICTYKDIAPKVEVMDPIDNLKEGGFEIAPETVTAEVVDDIEEKKRILEALENGEIEKSVKEPEQQKKTEWKKGGYSTKAQDVAFDEVEPVRQITTKRPNRTIRGLTPRLAECGKIKIGRKGEVKTSSRGNQFRPPEKIDHFIVTTMEKTGNDDFAPDTEIMRKLGGNCKEIPVRLPYDDPSLNFPTSYAYYDSAACQCRGDGVTAITSAGECIDCNPDTCPNVKDKKCKPNGVLSVILDDAPRVGGVYKFRTTGWNSINNIFSSMEFIRGLTNGLLAFLPLSLTLTPKNTVVPGTKTPTTIYMVNLEYRGSLKEMATAIQQTMSTRALTQYSVKDFEKLAEEALALPEAPEECKAIVEEFYPESVKVRA